MPNLYIIAGCNGAGKTTASFTILPEMLNCWEFVNADEIARGLSPFAAEGVSIEAGRIMLKRIDELIAEKKDFAFETTLASRSFTTLIKRAEGEGYRVTLLFFWLDSVEAAIDRVTTRVSEGGHNIPKDVIQRRYHAGIKNLFELYIPICNSWVLVDNSGKFPKTIAKGYRNLNLSIFDKKIFETIHEQSK